MNISISQGRTARLTGSESMILELWREIFSHRLSGGGGLSRWGAGVREVRALGYALESGFHTESLCEKRICGTNLYQAQTEQPGVQRQDQTECPKRSGGGETDYND